MHVLMEMEAASSPCTRDKLAPREVLEKLFSDHGSVSEVLEPLLDHLERKL